MGARVQRALRHLGWLPCKGEAAAKHSPAPSKAATTMNFSGCWHAPQASGDTEDRLRSGFAKAVLGHLTQWQAAVAEARAALLQLDTATTALAHYRSKVRGLRDGGASRSSGTTQAQKVERNESKLQAAVEAHSSARAAALACAHR